MATQMITGLSRLTGWKILTPNTSIPSEDFW